MIILGTGCYHLFGMCEYFESDLVYETLTQAKSAPEEQGPQSPVSRSPCKTHIILNGTTNNTASNANNTSTTGSSIRGGYSTKSGKFGTTNQNTNPSTSTESAKINSHFGDGAEVNAPETESSADNTNSTYPNTPNVHGTNDTANGASLSGIQPLLVANTIVIDVNDKVKGRFGKMLDKRYVVCFCVRNIFNFV